MTSVDAALSCDCSCDNCKQWWKEHSYFKVIITGNSLSLKCFDELTNTLTCVNYLESFRKNRCAVVWEWILLEMITELANWRWSVPKLKFTKLAFLSVWIKFEMTLLKMSCGLLMVDGAWRGHETWCVSTWNVLRFQQHYPFDHRASVVC